MVQEMTKRDLLHRVVSRHHPKKFRLRRKRRPKKVPKMTLMATMLSLKLKKKLDFIEEENEDDY